MDYNVNIKTGKNVYIPQLDGNSSNISSLDESNGSGFDLPDLSSSEHSFQPSESGSSDSTLNQSQQPSQISNESEYTNPSFIEDRNSIPVVMNLITDMENSQNHPAWFDEYVACPQ